MGKGELTRQAILERAVALASANGLEGLTIGKLATTLGLSKSGLFAHFQSKEALEVQVLEAAAARFVDIVVKPALAAPRGEPRLRRLLELWLGWSRSQWIPGGCVFLSAAFELRERPGPARDRLVALQADWLDTLATCVRTGITNGDFRPDTDAEQVAHEFHSATLGYHHAARLLRDPLAEVRLQQSFENIVTRIRSQPGREASRPHPSLGEPAH
jgi:AcrR family transcriptional regulator